MNYIDPFGLTATDSKSGEKSNKKDESNKKITISFDIDYRQVLTGLRDTVLGGLETFFGTAGTVFFGGATILSAPTSPTGIGFIVSGTNAALTLGSAAVTVDGARRTARGLITLSSSVHLSVSSNNENKVKKSETNNKSPKGNDGNAKPHGNPDHNGKIDEKINNLKGEVGNRDIRKNQTQVDANGNKVGNNRPDVQWTDKNGIRHYQEYDHNPASSANHGEVLIENDPNGIVHLEILE